jgi:hypothetical protein
MTLSIRNGVFKTGICIAAASLGGIITASFVIIPVYPEVITSAARRSSGIIQALAANFLQPASYAPFASMLSAVIYALITIVLIHHFFEKTQAPEILYFALFVLSFAFEGLRVVIPLKVKYTLPNMYLVMAARGLLFGRYYGFFSLFAASVYASGLEVQKQGNILFIIAVAALIIALGVPIDTLSWDSSLNMISGYQSMFGMLETGIILITMVSFFISAYSRGDKEYIPIGIGSLLVFMGRNILLNADTWASPLPGLLLLAAGTWFICTHLHRIYLWL